MSTLAERLEHQAHLKATAAAACADAELRWQYASDAGDIRETLRLLREARERETRHNRFCCRSVAPTGYDSENCFRCALDHALGEDPKP